jgi:hypothetical protein
MCRKKGRSALDTANKGAEVIVHLSIKGKGNSQSEHLHLSVYAQEGGFLLHHATPWSDAQVDFLLITCYHQQENCLQRERYFHYHVPINAGRSAQSFRKRPPQYVINYRYFTVF